MKIILVKDVENLGRAGEIVDVADGYGRNYLIPKKLAVTANTRNIKNLEHQKTMVESRVVKEKERAKTLVDDLEGKAIEIKARVGEDGKLFGSVTSSDIAGELTRQGYEIEKKQVLLDSVMKSVGEHRVRIKVSPGVTAEIVVTVSPE